MLGVESSFLFRVNGSAIIHAVRRADAVGQVLSIGRWRRSGEQLVDYWDEVVQGAHGRKPIRLA